MQLPPVLYGVFLIVVVPLAIWFTLVFLIGVRYIPHSRIGLVEKLWSNRGSLAEGRILACNGEAGIQAKILRGGMHFGYPCWIFRIHWAPLVTVSEGRIGYVYARDGAPLPPEQTLGRASNSNAFQDARRFLENSGQRGRQREILREGTYAINTALFVVITEHVIYTSLQDKMEVNQMGDWQRDLSCQNAFSPVRIGLMTTGPRHLSTRIEETHDAESGLSASDTIGVVTVHDGPPLSPGEFIAPQTQEDRESPGHQYFQDPEEFLALGGRRGRQLQVLTDGTYFVNRWFATVEMHAKTLIPIGFVGVVVSYYGNSNDDLTGDSFRYGMQVDTGCRGVWKNALAPGKYALNPYALKVTMVPTVNFVLRWINGQTENHKYDESLASIPIITADAYEPLLPLSLVLHIDYEKAPRVVQRFGDIKRLISQTLDPILTAYFRDVAQNSNMLDLLTKREEIQKHATEELGRRFSEYDINCVAVLIGRPDCDPSKNVQGHDPIEQLFDQLRVRRLAEEQKQTYASQQEAAVRLKELNHVQAEAERQTHLTATMVEIEIAKNRGAAQLAEAENIAKRDVALAQAQGQSARILGEGEAARIRQVGEAEAKVNEQKITAVGDPRLFALSQITAQLAQSQQPLVPEKIVMLGGGGQGGADNPAMGIFQAITQLLATWDDLREATPKK